MKLAFDRGREFLVAPSAFVDLVAKNVIVEF